MYKLYLRRLCYANTAHPVPRGARCPDCSKFSALGTQGTVINLVKVRALSAPFPKAARLARAFNKNMGPAETGSHLIRSDNGV